MHIHRPRRGLPRPARGVSLVELLMGLALALLVLAAASPFAIRQLRDTGRLQLQAQVQQELRAAADLALRDLRRAAHWDAAASGPPGGAGEAAQAHPHAALQVDAADGAVTYGHSSAGPTGLRLRGQVLQMLMGGAGWQPLTDPAAVQVLRFDLDVQTTLLPLPCARACAAGDAACPPVQHRRVATLRLEGRATHDPQVQRQLASRVSLPNDLVTGHCPA